MKTTTLTLLALIAFAGNSVVCRMALEEGAIDAGSFTWVRLVSGIAVLAVILWFSNRGELNQSKGSWMGGVTLFIYAAAFSYAYISLDTGTGALVLFGFVQVTMILLGLWSGERLVSFQWSGVAIAFLGLTYLMLPSASTPSVFGFLLMSIAGIAWGVYSLIGRNSQSPLSDTTFNFYRTLPLVFVLVLFTIGDSEISTRGFLLAVISGGVTSGVGYTIWYQAPGGLSSVQASVSQLMVPIFAAIGGVLLSNEVLSNQLIVSSAMVLCGILLVILGKQIKA